MLTIADQRGDAVREGKARAKEKKAALADGEVPATPHAHDPTAPK